MKEIPQLIKNDLWLSPYTGQIVARMKAGLIKEAELAGESTLYEFASGHLYFGLHKTDTGWVIREWAPNAVSIFLTGTFNNWEEDKYYAFKPLHDGIWELKLKSNDLHHGDLYALSMHWAVDYGKRIPAWASYVLQDPESKICNASVWAPEKPYRYKNTDFKISDEPPLIYEAHIGMAGEEERVHTYDEFRERMLPRIKANGYNTVQLMAIPEHPYYGSFGYHVSSFFAPSSRFGTPFELKRLIDEAHGMGLAVIMDIVHSHAVKNEVEGIGKYDGTRFQFFHEGGKGEHPAWDSYCFNYGKNEVLHFLLSNLKYWLEEFRFDGFRFDGVTSMLYFDHGLGKAFTSYDDYFNDNIDLEAVTYLILANKLIKQTKKHSVSVAEDMSGMPGLAVSCDHGGMGFDYRMAMGIPDYWIKLIKEKKDEEWDVGEMFYNLTSKRLEEKTVSYAESHDQALVGDKTIIFRLIDKDMYFSMRIDQPNLIVDRGIALHKMIRLITASTAGGAYLNFMGNEFGHPEWIDFPREGNGWSYKHCRRIWSIADDPELKFHWLYDFDCEMIGFIRNNLLLNIPSVNLVTENKADKVIAFHRGYFLFVFNFNPEKSFTDYGIPLGPGKYKIVLSTDSGRFGGYDRIDEELSYYTIPSGNSSSQHFLKLYIPARTAIVFEKLEFQKIV
ncbi:MAG: alpha amylase C-terminal domain-containing protein [Prolixibacteraceae bacterium]|jgi:1,4-alpha-glucan branching enzyme|nr:alpha amylase C-terminal domain-containing protein [Prolixibacteraceae bacterium]MDD4754776.1 alpha amylase C-terminal domain-containing protein [Prolixibacteraceae bacterium]